MSVDGNEKVIQRWDDQKLWGAYQVCRNDSTIVEAKSGMKADSHREQTLQSFGGPRVVIQGEPCMDQVSSRPEKHGVKNADKSTQLYVALVTQICADCQRNITGALSHKCPGDLKEVTYCGPNFMNGEGA